MHRNRQTVIISVFSPQDTTGIPVTGPPVKNSGGPYIHKKIYVNGEHQ